MLKRIYLPDQIYFVTSKTYQNQFLFSDYQNCQLFFKTLKDCKVKYKFKLYGFTLMPDHVHLLIMPGDNMDISEVIHRIKGNFAYQYIIMMRNHKGFATRRNNKQANDAHSNRVADHSWVDDNGNNFDRVADPLWVGDKARQRIRVHPIWQKSFYDHVIRNNLDFIEKLNYIHKNPIKHGLTDNLDNYFWSSYQNYYLSNNNLIEIDNIEL